MGWKETKNVLLWNETHVLFTTVYTTYVGSEFGTHSTKKGIHTARELKLASKRDWVSWCASTRVCDVNAKQQCGMEKLIYTIWQPSDIPIYWYDIALPKVEFQTKARMHTAYRCVDHAVECFENIAFSTIRNRFNGSICHGNVSDLNSPFPCAQQILR